MGGWSLPDSPLHIVCDSVAQFVAFSPHSAANVTPSEFSEKIHRINGLPRCGIIPRAHFGWV
jgi:hypothetical protein